MGPPLFYLLILLQSERWYKGNTHTHTYWSDGDAAPEVSADWYKSHGYHFLVLSDHNILAQGVEKWVDVKQRKVPLDELAKKFGDGWVKLRGTDEKKEMSLKTLGELKRRFEEREKFIFIAGEEISNIVKTQRSGASPLHHNSLNQENLIKVPNGGSMRETMKRVLAAVQEEAQRTGKPMLVHLNHPNFGWALTPDDVARVVEERYFEVYNGHPLVNNYGDPEKDRPGTEAIWDYALTLRLGELRGPVLFGLATDDAHHFYPTPKRGSNPGRGWIMVRAGELTPDAIVLAMQAGNFYASSGVTLEDVSHDAVAYSIRVRAQPGVKYAIRFIGARGAVLQETQGTTASYKFTGNELYVRATILSDRPHPNPFKDGDFETAWTQPVVPRP